MADEIISNLEPIDEKDLNLKNKFIVGEKSEKEGKEEKNVSPESGKIEKIPLKEVASERKEGAVEKESAYSKILSKVPAQTKPAEEHNIKKDAEIANAGLDAESKINNLVKIAETKGIFHAVKVAKHMESFYVLDEFHDRLLGEELHSALVKKGIIKEI